MFADEPQKVCFVLHGARVAVAVADQTCDQIIAGCAFNGVFASGKNVCDADHIGVVEAGAEIIEQAVQTRVPMRLVDCDHAALCGLAGSFQHGCNLNRMMPVVVDDRDPIHFTYAGEAPVYTSECGQCCADFIQLHAEVTRNRDSRERVRYVVIPRHGQRATFDGFVFRL